VEGVCSSSGIVDRCAQNPSSRSPSGPRDWPHLSFSNNLSHRSHLPHTHFPFCSIVTRTYGRTYKVIDAVRVLRLHDFQRFSARSLGVWKVQLRNRVQFGSSRFKREHVRRTGLRTGFEMIHRHASRSCPRPFEADSCSSKLEWSQC